MKIKKGDKIKVMKGKDRGKTAKVARVLVDSRMVVVEGLNLVKKVKRARKQGEKNQMISIPQPIRVENVMLVCSSCGKPTRTGIKVHGDKRTRYCKKCKTNV